MSHPFSSAEKGAAEGRFTGIIPAAFGNCPIFSWFRRCDRDSSPLQCSSYENQSGVGFFFTWYMSQLTHPSAFSLASKLYPWGILPAGSGICIMVQRLGKWCLAKVTSHQVIYWTFMVRISVNFGRPQDYYTCIYWIFHVYSVCNSACTLLDYTIAFVQHV